MRDVNSLIHAPTKRLAAWLDHWGDHLKKAIIGRDYNVTPEGIVFFDDKRLRGDYFHRLASSPWRPADKEFAIDHNLVVDEGIMYALAHLFQSSSPPALLSAWYLTLFSGSTTPANTLTAANFASTQSEITSSTEGFSNATRPACTFGAPASNLISNSASQAAFNIVCTTSLSVTGGALLSDSTRGGTSGKLWSASLFSSARTLFNGEVFNLGYQTSLSD
jgi:hypothetical protein